MKIGDEVNLKYEFRIISYNLDRDYMVVKIKEGEHKIPIYIGNLAFYLPEFDFCIPGKSLGPTHPDYLDADEGADKLIGVKDGKRVEIKLDPNFQFNGQYRVITESKDIITMKKAQRWGRDSYKTALSNISDEEFDGSMLSGTIVRICAITQRREIIYHHEVPSNIVSEDIRGIKVIVQDSYTFIEYNLPSNLWLQKSYRRNQD